jgi:tRNA (cytidine/uridine-2'-O-)-methyltransferase
MLNVVLVEPEIPPNTGNVIRLCANAGARLHLVEPLGFPLDHSKMRRAGLDYHELALFETHSDWPTFLATASPDPERMFAITTRGSTGLGQIRFQENDWLIFGSETRGLGTERLAEFDTAHRVRIPMRPDNRSLNLSNAVAIVVYEAWRQLAYSGSV